MTKNVLIEKGQKIRVWVDLPPLIRAMPERKRFFSIDVFPKCACTRFDSIDDDNGDDSDYDDGDGKDDGDDDDVKDDNEGVRLVAGLARI